MLYFLRNPKILGVFLFLMLFQEALSQSDYLNHTKYWYYRTRLRNDFLLVGAGQGMSIPMQQRGLWYYPYTSTPQNYNFTSNPNGALGVDGALAQWGDAMGDLGYYIGVLATEYQLLSMNYQATDSTLKELFYALYALNRMDKNGEVLWDRLVTNGVQQSQAMCFTPGGCLNGFMCRDDVDFDFVQNNYDHFNYFGNRGFCSKVKINTEVDGSGDHHSSWSTAYYETGPNYKGGFISQDNYINVVTGLTLVRKLVPDQVSYLNKSFQDNETYLYREAIHIEGRVLSWFSNTNSLGFMYYPDMHTHIAAGNGGYVAPYLYAFEESLTKHASNMWDNYNPTEISGNRAFHDACDRHQYLHVNTGHPAQDAATNAWRATFGIAARWLNYYVFSNHSVSSATNAQEAKWKISLNTGQGNTVHNDAAVMTENLMAVCNCVYDFVSNRTGTQMFGPEFSTYNFNTGTATAVISRDLYHGKLLKYVLYGSENCGYGEDNPYPWNELSSTYALLTSAPCEGTFAYPQGMGPQATYEWNTTNRLDHAPRREERQPSSCQCDGGMFFAGEYNGLDYMLYHNLYYLTRNGVTPDNENKLVDFSNRYLTLSYPLSTPNTLVTNAWGSQTNPATVGAYEVINASCTINNNAVVDFKAGKEIQLANGFSAIPGSHWSANIQQLVCTDIFNQNNSYDNINGRSTNAPSGSSNSNEIPFGALPTSFVVNNVPPVKINLPLKNMPSNTNPMFLTKSLENINLDQSVSVFPNPSNGVFVIRMDNPNHIREMVVQNALGEIVYTITRNIDAHTNINLSDVKPGIYLLKITDATSKLWYKKIVKN